MVILSNFFPDRRRNQEAADKLWSAILDRSDEITPDTVASVFRILPLLKRSRDVVANLVRERVGEFWQSYKPR